jgi:hypothetical protein
LDLVVMWKIFLWLFFWQQIFCLEEDLDEIRDSISADIAMRTTHRPVIYLFSQDLASDLIPLIQSELTSSSSSAENLRCFDLLLTNKPEDDLSQFAASPRFGSAAGSIAIFTGIESLSGMNLTRLNFLHSVSDSSSNSFGNLFVILVWNSLIRPFPSHREELHTFLSSRAIGPEGTEGGTNLNTRALVGRISRLKSHPRNDEKLLQQRTENPIPLLCQAAARRSRGTGARGETGNDWTLLYLLSAIVAIFGTLSFQYFSPVAPPVAGAALSGSSLAALPTATHNLQSPQPPSPPCSQPQTGAISQAEKINSGAAVSLSSDGRETETEVTIPELLPQSSENSDRPRRVRQKKSKGSSTW